MPLSFFSNANLQKYWISAETHLAQEMENNVFYPFDLGESLYSLELTVRYKSLYAALLLFIGSLSIMVSLLVARQVNEVWFFGSICTLLVSLALINNYKDTRHYVLNMALMEYTFSHSSPFFKRRKVLISSQYHNIYIRMRKEYRDGSKRYYLVLNGYRIDARRISGSTRKQEALRKLGHKIAENLNLNYFDVTNASEHHVIRHERPQKKRHHRKQEEPKKNEFE